MMKLFKIILILVATVFGVSSQLTLSNTELLKNNGRIIGGHEVGIFKHPHQVSLRRKKSFSAFKHFCGGSIYDEETIITAAHCVVNKSPRSIMIVAGTSVRNGADGAVALVSEIIMYKGYNQSALKNDIALLKLATPLPLNGFTMAAIPIASKTPKDGEKATVTGWGNTEYGNLPEQLLEVEMPIISNDRCEAAYAARFGVGIISDSMICAGFEGVGGKDACQGDSGGPLLVNRKLAGIVSWGQGCGEPDFPGVYANVAHFKDWIETTVKRN